MTYTGFGIERATPPPDDQRFFRRTRGFVPPSITPQPESGMPAYTWRGYAGAFGIAVPTPLPGQADYAPEMGATGFNYCGSMYGFQQMLADLGYYTGLIDGKIGPGSRGAAEDFAAEHGAPWGGPLTDEFCQKLIEVWTAQMGGAAPEVPGVETAPVARLTIRPDIARARLRIIAQKAGAIPVDTKVTPNGQSAIEKAKTWWVQASTGTKVAVGVGAAAVVGLIIYVLVGGGGAARVPAAASPNRYRRNRRLTKGQRRAAATVRAKVGGTRRAQSKKGKVTTLKGGKRYGHIVPPKKYWGMGARRQGDYADPEHYKYPLVFRSRTGKVNRVQTAKHIKAAKTRFTRHKRRYPPALRRKIARNINKAAKRYGVDGKVMKP